MWLGVRVGVDGTVSVAVARGSRRLWDRISVRVTTPVLLIVVIASIAGPLVLRSTSLAAVSHEDQGQSQVLRGLVGDAALLAKGAANDERGFLLFGDPEFTTEFDDDRVRPLQDVLGEMAGLATPTTATLVDRYRTEIDTWLELVEEEFSLHASDPQAARRFHLDVVRPARKTHEATGQELTAAIDVDLESDEHAHAEAMNRTQTTIRFALAAMAIMVTVALVALVRSIAKPIKKLAATAQLIAAGETDIDPIANRRQDEIGELTGSFNRLIATTGLLTRQSELISHGDLSSPILDEAVPGRLGRAHDRMISSLKTVTTEIKSSAVHLNNSATDLSDLSSHLATTAVGASEHATVVSNSIEELNATTARIADQLEDATSRTQQAVEVSRHTNKTIAALDQSSSQIGEVVKVIQAVAEQTNLLALNATIEAARAGDYGKGFAVVASEVKGLASQTAEATEQIAARVAAIQRSTNEAVDSNGRIGETIDMLNRLAVDIAAAIDQQSTNAQTIAINVEDLVMAANQTNRSSAATKQSAVALDEMASRLEDLAHRYH